MHSLIKVWDLRKSHKRRVNPEHLESNADAVADTGAARPHGISNMALSPNGQKIYALSTDSRYALGLSVREPRHKLTTTFAACTRSIRSTSRSRNLWGSTRTRRRPAGPSTCASPSVRAADTSRREAPTARCTSGTRRATARMLSALSATRGRFPASIGATKRFVPVLALSTGGAASDCLAPCRWPRAATTTLFACGAFAGGSLSGRGRRRRCGGDGAARTTMTFLRDSYAQRPPRYPEYPN